MRINVTFEKIKGRSTDQQSRQPMKRTNPFSKGKLNRLVDDLVHPYFKTNKSSILLDGLLHGLIEQNPGLSMEKFVRFDLPELMKVKTKRKIPGERKRSYNCTLSVNARCIFCNYKKAGPWCLRAGIFGGRCQKLVTMYKRVR